MLRKILYLTILLHFVLLMKACNTTGTASKISGVSLVELPFIKNSASECYYLDEFMPVPDNMVTGKFGKLDLRYYSYKTANYREWEKKHIVLSFYSQNERCWSLFEEYYIND